MSAASVAEPLPYEVPAPRAPGKVVRRIGWGITGLIAAMLAMGGVMDVVKPPFVVEGLARAGFAEAVALPLGLVTIASAILFMIPRTAVFGAVLLTAYLGGAVAIHAQLQEFGQMFVPVAFAAIMWAGLCMRDRRFRALLF